MTLDVSYNFFFLKTTKLKPVYLVKMYNWTLNNCKLVF